MRTDFKYENLFGVEITVQQIGKEDEAYIKKSYEGTEIRSKEVLDGKDNLISIFFYLKENEIVSQALVDLGGQYNEVGFYFNKLKINNFTTWDVESYTNQICTGKAKVAFDNRGRKLASQNIDVTTLAIMETEKYFYLDNLGPFSEFQPVIDNGVLKFYYNYDAYDPGDVFVVINLLLHQDASGGGYIIDNDENVSLEDEMLASVFNWQCNPYYHSAGPLIPISISM